MNNLFPDMENPWIRRPLIALIVTCGVPFLFAIFIAEIIWDSANAMYEITKKHINEIKPTIAGLIEQIKGAW